MFIQVPFTMDRENEVVSFGSEIIVGEERYIESNSEILEIWQDVQTSLANLTGVYQYLVNCCNVTNYDTGWISFKAAKKYTCNGESVTDFGCVGGICDFDFGASPDLLPVYM